MKTRTTLATFAATALAVTALPTAADAQSSEEQFIAIGTGGLTGVYYPAGGAICRLMNRDRAEHGIRCAVESTGGSIYNINTIQAGELDFGVAQSDWQYHAYNGSSKFAENPVPELRSVFSLHPEPFTVVAAADSGIESFEDLKGKRVNIGNPGSGQRATMEVLMDEYGWTEDDFALATEYKAAESPQQLCDGNIDAYLYVVGHPSANIEEAASTCGAQLVDVEGPVIDELIEENPFYRTATIPAGTYPGIDEDTTTFGVGATLVTSEEVPEDVVYELAMAVMMNLEDFRNLHPAFANLQATEMIYDANSAPLHRGAVKAYGQLGLLED